MHLYTACTSVRLVPPYRMFSNRILPNILGSGMLTRAARSLHQGPGPPPFPLIRAWLGLGCTGLFSFQRRCAKTGPADHVCRPPAPLGILPFNGLYLSADTFEKLASRFLPARPLTDIRPNTDSQNSRRKEDRSALKGGGCHGSVVGGPIWHP
jgi:hypothetical protein